MVELQEPSWLSWFIEPVGIFLTILVGPLLLAGIIAVGLWLFDTIRGVREIDRGLEVEGFVAVLLASALVCVGVSASFAFWIDVNDSEAQIDEIEDAYDVAIFDVNDDGDVEEFVKMKWDYLVTSTDDTYQSQEPVAIRGDDGELRTDAVLLLEREDLDDPFTASIAIPEEPEPGQTLVDYKTGEIVGESTVDTEEEETD